MNIRWQAGLPFAVAAMVACGSSSDPAETPAPGAAGSAGAPSPGGVGGASGSGTVGGSASAGAPSSTAGGGSSSSVGGSAGSGASAGGSSGSSGGSVGSGGSGANGGSGGSAGASAGGSAGGSGGSASLKDVASALDGLRLEDPCGNTPATDHTCKHVGSTSDSDAFAKNASATIAGSTGKSYVLKLRVRGATEPTHTQGGKAGTPKNYVVGSMPYARGTNEANYQYWRVGVQGSTEYSYLNSFDAQGLSHTIHELDFTISLTVPAGGKVNLEMRDENGHLIANDAGVHPDGVAAAPNSGQFVQLNVEEVTLAP